MRNLSQKTGILTAILTVLTVLTASPTYAQDTTAPDSHADVRDVYDVNDTSAADTTDIDSGDTVADTKDTTTDSETGTDTPVKAPEDVEGVVSTIKKAVYGFKKGSWLLFAIAIIQILMFTIKRLRPTKWIAKDYGAVIVLSLSAVASVLSLVVGGASVVEAIVVFVGSSGTKVIHDIAHKAGLIDHKYERSEITAG